MNYSSRDIENSATNEAVEDWSKAIIGVKRMRVSAKDLEHNPKDNCRDDEIPIVRETVGNPKPHTRNEGSWDVVY